MGIVGVSDTIEADVAKLNTAISDAQGILKKLTENGNNLANPKSWSGEKATIFRNAWQGISQEFTDIGNKLIELHGVVQEITTAIRNAG